MRGLPILVLCACASSFTPPGADDDAGLDVAARPPPGELGDPCIPVAAPDPLFSNEVYVERGSSACSRVEACIAVQLDGSPYTSREDCGRGPGCEGLASRADIAERVFCSCRCTVPASSLEPPCECAPGFFCDARTDFATPGSPVSGAYCVRESLR
ncbi:MAG: hypothetical protein AAF411_11870 [Myxococcota bacterium]